MGPIQPVFIISVPRSGSTLLQRMLAKHPQIYSRGEPWILLPQVVAMQRCGVDARYRHGLWYRAWDAFCEQLPHGKESYRSAVRELILRLYSEAAQSSDASHFLDKSPPYALIVDDIATLFPGARFIFLWRNPIGILASIAATYGRGRWRIYPLRHLVVEGLRTMAIAADNHADRVLEIQYESMVVEPEKTIRSALGHLGLEYDERCLLSASDPRAQREAFGDPTGVERYTTVSDQSLQKWRTVVCNLLRRWSVQSVLRDVGEPT